jgi:hypothetical protein
MYKIAIIITLFTITKATMLSNYYVVVDINVRNVIVHSYSKLDNEKSRRKYKIKHNYNKRFFHYKQDSVYLDYDIEPIYKDTLIKYFAERISVADFGPYRTNFFSNIIFIIDKDGNVISSGYLNHCYNEFYCGQILEILAEFDKKFIPAKVNGEIVTSLYIFELGIYNDDFIKYNSNRKKEH